jgi:hypothetical protein
VSDRSLQRALGEVWQGLTAAARFVIAHPFRTTLAMLLLIVGIIGLIAPIMPGWVFIFLAIFVLGPRTKAARWLKRRLAVVRRYFRKRGLLRRKVRRLNKPQGP